MIHPMRDAISVPVRRMGSEGSGQRPLGHDFELAAGFLLSEGILEDRARIAFH